MTEPEDELATLDFDLSKVVSSLTYNFDGKGKKSIPEPSSAQIRAYRAKLAEVLQEAVGLRQKALGGKRTMPTDPLGQAQLVSRLLGAEDRNEALEDKTLLGIAELCSDHPSFDELKILHFRGQRAFMGWLSGVFLNPEA